MTFTVWYAAGFGAAVAVLVAVAVAATRNVRRLTAEIRADLAHPVAGPAARGWAEYEKFTVRRHRRQTLAVLLQAWQTRGATDLADDEPDLPRDEARVCRHRTGATA